MREADELLNDAMQKLHNAINQLPMNEQTAMLRQLCLMFLQSNKKKQCNA